MGLIAYLRKKLSKRGELEWKREIEAQFAASDTTDAILLVDSGLGTEKVRFHVNKAHLASHSDFFECLFNGAFKEKDMSEIVIADVNCFSFGQLLKIIDPIAPIKLTAENAYTLLVLADRFLMPAVTRCVERYLCSNTAHDLVDKIKWADWFGMNKLLLWCLNQFETGVELEVMVKEIGNEISSETRSRLEYHYLYLRLIQYH
ncbi:unnamed protein product [Caenorhabditis sp. 36 PRJEB53466]|nr:unnamed protein product [Caenorhabditis sp. 36 PRJEB53466]